MAARRAMTVVSEKCTGCHLCRLACTHIKTSTFGLSQALIEITRVGLDEKYEVSLKPECNRCGFCVNYCGYGAIERAASVGAEQKKVIKREKL